MELPKTHTNALQWLADRGGEGVIDQHGSMLASGERMSPFSAPVWLRLFTTGHVQSAGRNRVSLTSDGKALTKTRGNPVMQDREEWRRQLDEDDMAGGAYG